MESSLRIFISHKMPTDTGLAEEIGSRLALYGGSQVTIAHAGRFRYGDKWRERIEEELRAADWLIFLNTGQNEDWGFCLYECGYFSNTGTSADGRPKLLKTFCRRGEQINAALQPFNALEISVAAIVKLLREIYVDPPYAFKPTLAEDKLIQTAQEIVSLFEGGERVERNFDVAPSITIELMLDDACRERLRSGLLPTNAPVTGLSGWQRLFGKAIDTGGWEWGELRNDWPYVEVYEYLIAKMMLDALNGRQPSGWIFRAPGTDELYRMTLRRFEKFAGDKHRFHFVAAPVDLPFELLQQGTTVEETMLYHLVNLTWYFRRRIVDKLYGRVLELKSTPSMPIAAVTNLYDELGKEMMLVTAQSIMRKVDNVLSVRRALGVDDPVVVELLERSAKFPEMQKRVFAAMQRGAAGLEAIATDLYEMAEQNYEFYNVAARRYSELATNLPHPEKP